MKYINTTTLAYPITEQQIRMQYPNVSFGLPFTPPNEYAMVSQLAKPAHNANTQNCVLSTTPVLNGVAWEIGWDVTDKTQEELDARAAYVRGIFITKIKMLRDDKLQKNGYQVGTNWFHSDTFSRTQQIALFSLGANIPVGLQWKTMDGSFVEMTQQLAADIFAAGVASDTAVFAHAEALIAAINASPGVPTTDIYAGWPAGYSA